MKPSLSSNFINVIFDIYCNYTLILLQLFENSSIIICTVSFICTGSPLCNVRCKELILLQLIPCTLSMCMSACNCSFFIVFILYSYLIILHSYQTVWTHRKSWYQLFTIFFLFYFFHLVLYYRAYFLHLHLIEIAYLIRILISYALL